MVPAGGRRFRPPAGARPRSRAAGAGRRPCADALFLATGPLVALASGWLQRDERRTRSGGHVRALVRVHSGRRAVASAAGGRRRSGGPRAARTVTVGLIDAWWRGVAGMDMIGEIVDPRRRAVWLVPRPARQAPFSPGLFHDAGPGFRRPVGAAAAAGHGPPWRDWRDGQRGVARCGLDGVTAGEMAARRRVLA